MDNTTASFGMVNPTEFSQKFPALSAKLAATTASKTGLDPKDPANVVSAMHSNVFKTEAGKAASATDPAVIDKVFNPPKFAADTASVEDQTKAAFDAKEGNAANVLGAKKVLFQKSQEASDQLAELSRFNAETYTQERLKELNPTKDIDNRLLELRMQAFTAKSMLETDPEIMALPPALQARAIASKMGVFNDAIVSLGKMRETRLASAKDQIGKETAATQKQIDVAQSRVDSIDRQIKQLTEIGGDQDTIASLRLDRIKEMDRLAKARNRGGGMTTQKEFVYQKLQEEYRAEHGQAATGQDADTLRSQAEQIISSDPTLAARAGTTVPSMGTETVEEPIPLWQRILDPLSGPTKKMEVTKYDVPTSILKARGYGVPLGTNEIVKMRKDRADLAIAENKAKE